MRACSSACVGTRVLARSRVSDSEWVAYIQSGKKQSVVFHALVSFGRRGSWRWESEEEGKEEEEEEEDRVLERGKKEERELERGGDERQRS